MVYKVDKKLFYMYRGKLCLYESEYKLVKQ